MANKHPDYGIGKAIFPGKRRQGDRVRHDTVRVMATVAGEPDYVYFRAFDVDDPHEDAVIDPNGTMGNDNHGRPKPGYFIPYGGSYARVPVEDGRAVVLLAVTYQPGDNFRVAVSCKASEVKKLQIWNPSAPGYVPPSNDQLPDFDGKLTPLLTVWRKLWVENDRLFRVTSLGHQPTVILIGGRIDRFTKNELGA